MMNTLPAGTSRLAGRHLLNAPNAVLAVTILAGVASVALAVPALSTGRLMGVAVCTLLYLGWAIVGYAWCERQANTRNRLIYFGTALLLTGAVLLLSRLAGIIWLIFMPLASHAAQQPRGWALGVYAIVLLEFFGVLIPLSGVGPAFASVVQLAGGLGFVFVFTHIAARESQARVEMETLAGELRQANEKLSEYAAQAEELAITRERNRLAREIHDSLGHYLTVVHVQLEAARVLIDSHPAQAKDAVAKAQSLTKNGLAEIRQSVAALRASPLDGRTLGDAIRALVEDHRSSGRAVVFEMHGEPFALGSAHEMTLYRAAQEGLTNIRKHAPEAAHAWVALDYGAGQVDLGQVGLRVRDDGAGAGATKLDGDAAPGFGLLGLRERVQLLGGQFSTQSREGFVLQVILFVENVRAVENNGAALS